MGTGRPLFLGCLLFGKIPPGRTQLDDRIRGAGARRKFMLKLGARRAQIEAALESAGFGTLYYALQGVVDLTDRSNTRKNLMNNDEQWARHSPDQRSRPTSPMRGHVLPPEVEITQFYTQHRILMEGPFGFIWVIKNMFGHKGPVLLNLEDVILAGLKMVMYDDPPHHSWAPRGNPHTGVGASHALVDSKYASGYADYLSGGSNIGFLDN
ncbi:hypothetical protein Cgig2_004220 [Carnegiea gigantea]|uniref:Uncharacterized protein n=1 Tax=Carnegiea gigantea TaxID=171969 RepID=A0A9Q1GWK5_9CARY|nr:hypothetical protein Cgig2_004220 [Carnegiea gigantea]